MEKNRKITLFLNLLKNNIIIIAPNPYIGQNDPIRNPVLISFFSQIVLTILSKTHPKNE